MKQIINSWSFLFLLTHIELNFNFKKCLNKRDDHENLDFSGFFNWPNQNKKRFRINPYFASAISIYLYIHLSHSVSIYLSIYLSMKCLPVLENFGLHKCIGS